MPENKSHILHSNRKNPRRKMRVEVYSKTQVCIATSDKEMSYVRQTPIIFVWFVEKSVLRKDTVVFVY
jgi:hypothetical protein